MITITEFYGNGERFKRDILINVVYAYLNENNLRYSPELFSELKEELSHVYKYQREEPKPAKKDDKMGFMKNRYTAYGMNKRPY